jgi:hypothetical protein
MTLLQPLFLQAATGDATISYTGQQFRNMLATIITGDGVSLPGDLAITQRGAGANMSVDIAPGSFAVTGDTIANQGVYIAQSTATFNLPITAANATNPRIDLIVAQIFDKQAGGGATTYSWSPVAVVGTPAASPVAPALPNSALLLGPVTVPANATSIVTANISDQRVALQTPAAPQDHMGSVATVAGSGITGAFGLTTGGQPISQGVLFATRACSVSIQFAMDFIGAAGASCTVNVQYALNGGALTIPAGGSQPTGALVSGDNPRVIVPADIQLAAGDKLSLNASISAVVGSLSWYAPTFTYTARAAVHV